MMICWTRCLNQPVINKSFSICPELTEEKYIVWIPVILNLIRQAIWGNQVFLAVVIICHVSKIKNPVSSCVIMICHQYPISPYSVELLRKDFHLMVKVVRLLHKLSQNSAYQALLQDSLPIAATLNPGYHAVMMGYDFHLSESGPKLIEVNSNAGGAWYAYLCEYPAATEFAGRSANRLLNTFLTDYALFRRSADARPECIAIVDAQPETQFLYPEMQVFAALFKQSGIKTAIADPEMLIAKNGALYLNDQRVDMIYNRHCDFYLQTPEMQTILNAWMNNQVCLSPNPHTYGLLADKRRMILWSDPEQLWKLGLSRHDLELLGKTIPRTALLESLSMEEAWHTRKQWVFKPDTGYASRGVYVGSKLTTVKLAELDPHNTVIQRWIPPSISKYIDELPFKTDFRLFAYRNQIMGVSARLYQGQVTNLRTPNGGFARVVIV